MSAEVRDTDAAHAPVLARLKCMANNDLPLVFWDKAREPGETALDAGIRLLADPAERADMRVCLRDGQVVGLAQSFLSPEPPAPSLPELAPLGRLKARIVGHLYLDTIAVLPAARRTGAATALLRDCLARAGAVGAPAVSLLVLGQNHGARATYERFGFAEAARAALQPEHWPIPPQDIVLMTRPLDP